MRGEPGIFLRENSESFQVPLPRYEGRAQNFSKWMLRIFPSLRDCAWVRSGSSKLRPSAARAVRERETFREEVATIEYHAWAEEFTYDIDRMIHKKLVSRALDFATFSHNFPLRKRSRWIPQPYFRKHSPKLSTTLPRPVGLRATFYNLTTLSKLFLRLKDPIPPPYQKSGVYRF